jgi:hypothetical protein
MTLAPVPKHDSAAFADASIVRCCPAILFSKPLTVIAAMPRMVNINSTITTVNMAMPCSLSRPAN